MAKVMVVTDSSAQISAKEAKLHDITVVPLNIHFGDEILKEGEDLSPEEFFQRAEHSPVMPTASAPSPAVFSQVYRELHKRSNKILSLHVSSKLSKTLQIGRAHV
jgi:DegV family protein with EDD domain